MKTLYDLLREFLATCTMTTFDINADAMELLLQSPNGSALETLDGCYGTQTVVFLNADSQPAYEIPIEAKIELVAAGRIIKITLAVTDTQNLVFTIMRKSDMDQTPVYQIRYEDNSLQYVPMTPPEAVIDEEDDPLGEEDEALTDEEFLTDEDEEDTAR